MLGLNLDFCSLTMEKHLSHLISATDDGICQNCVTHKMIFDENLLKVNYWVKQKNISLCYHTVLIFFGLIAAAFLWAKCHLDAHNKQWPVVQPVVECASASVFDYLASDLALEGSLLIGMLVNLLCCWTREVQGTGVKFIVCCI